MRARAPTRVWASARTVTRPSAAVSSRSCCWVRSSDWYPELTTRFTTTPVTSRTPSEIAPSRSARRQASEPPRG